MFIYSLFVDKIPSKATTRQIKKAFKDCTSVSFIKHPNNTKNAYQQAILQFKDRSTAINYLMDKNSVPIIGGKRLIVKTDTRKQKKKTPELKIWDGTEDITGKINFNDADEQSVDESSNEEQDEATSEEDEEEEETEESADSNDD